MDDMTEVETRKRGGQDGARRYDSKQFNALKAVADREVKHDSLKCSTMVGQDGIHRYDVSPMKNLNAATYQGPDFYMTCLKAKKGTTKFSDSPLFMVKGLHNYSNLPAGDARVYRATSTSHEQFLSPTHRADVPPKFSHLQGHEPWDQDLQLGPVSNNGFGPLKNAAPGPGDAEAVAERTRIYRECIESVSSKNPGRLDELELMFRDKLNMYAAGSRNSSEGYHLKNTFRYLDRDARGVVDLASFCNTIKIMGINADETLCIALFARYDAQRRGFLDFQDFSKYLMGQDFLSRNTTTGIAKQVTRLLRYLKENGSFSGLRLDVRKSQGLGGSGSIHFLTDEEFMQRQKLLAAFRKIDVDGNDAVEFNEYEKMLRKAGCVLNPKELRAVFEHIDSDSSGQISFEEFYEFYLLEIPGASGDQTEWL